MPQTSSGYSFGLDSNVGSVSIVQLSTPFRERAAHEFFSSLWSQAAAALRRADKVVLCGYSLLPVDERACDLLLKATRKQSSIVVVSGSDGKRITQTLRNAGFQSIECHESGYFDAWVESTMALIATAL
jgi:hypothetical protein